MNARVFAALIMTLLAGCKREAPVRTIVAKFKEAECVPVSIETNTGPPTRTWDSMLTRRNGSPLHISGAQMRGRPISLEYFPDGPEVAAAHPGDYIYPVDVRFARTDEQLYVLASGFSLIAKEPQTWIFEFDVGTQQQTARERVNLAELPSPCLGVATY